jgi:acyl dehydratase
MSTSDPIAELRTHTGEELGVSDWLTVTQAMIDEFANATGDHQWIHTDPARAVNTPFGGTIAHGYFTLALIPQLLDQVFPLDRFGMVVNYGLDKLRFPSPLPSGGRIRVRARLDRVDTVAGGASVALTLVVEGDGIDKPICVANALYRVAQTDQT